MKRDDILRILAAHRDVLKAFGAKTLKPLLSPQVEKEAIYVP